MHITFLALGSRGDVTPCITLGRALAANGHQVRLATFENFAESVQANRLDFHPIRGDAEQLLRTSQGMALAESGRNLIKSIFAAMRSFGALAESYARDLSSPRLWETDLIINQLPAGLFGYDLAEKAGVPMLTAAVIPLTRTRSRPSMGFPELPFHLPGYNTLTHRVAEQVVWQNYRSTIRRWRQSALGLGKGPFFGPYGANGLPATPVLNGFSRFVVPRPADWGDHVHVTGYWFADHSGWQPSQDLVEFLNTGRRPIFVGFGSMPVRDPERLLRLVLDALKRTGQRAVLLPGMAKMAAESLPESVFALDFAPYDWLFEHVAAVVHHGGSGTTAAGLKAGRPNLIVPFVFDQFYWGRRVADLVLGPEPIPFKSLSAERLAEAMTELTQDRRYQEEATEIGRKIKAEPGIASAVRIIESYR